MLPHTHETKLPITFPRLSFQPGAIWSCDWSMTTPCHVLEVVKVILKEERVDGSSLGILNDHGSRSGSKITPIPLESNIKLRNVTLKSKNVNKTHKK